MRTFRAFIHLLGWLFLVCLCLSARAAQVKFECDPYPSLQTHLFTQDAAGAKKFLTHSTGHTFTAEMEPGVYQVTAAQETVPGIWSGFCDPITVTVLPTPLPPAWLLEGNTLTTGDGDRIRLTIQFSRNLTDWTDKPSPSARFYRIKAESP